MRRWIVFALALVVSIGFTTDAEAGKKNKKNKNKGGEETAQMEESGGEEAAAEAPAAEEEAEELSIEETGIADVDAIFQKADAPIQNIKAARMSIDQLTTDLNQALGVAEDAPFSTAIADLKEKAGDKLTVAMNEQGIPKLEAADGVPENVQTAVDAANDGFAAAGEAVAKLAEVPSQVQEVIAEAKALNPKSLTESGVKPLEAPKVMKTIGANLKVLGMAPEEVKALEQSLTTLKKELTNGISS